MEKRGLKNGLCVVEEVEGLLYELLFVRERCFWTGETSSFMFLDGRSEGMSFSGSKSAVESFLIINFEY